MRWPRVPRCVAVGAGACLLLSAALCGGSSGAAGAAEGPDADSRVATWDEAASTLGTAGSLWEPMLTSGLDRVRRIRVIADDLTFGSGAGVGTGASGQTTTAAAYGAGERRLWVQEKWAGTSWAAEPEVSTTSALVDRVSLRLGPPGTRITVPAAVYADCFPQPAGGPVRIPSRFRCSRADVLRFGGRLVMTARPSSTMSAPGDTTIVLRSSGVTYRQLLSIARSMQQVAGTPTVAGSAQMVGMCRQMVTGPMSVDQATGFAQSWGYLVRVGTIDGQPQAVTMDYRPDRFTVSVVGGPGGTVTGCDYG